MHSKKITTLSETTIFWHLAFTRDCLFELLYYMKNCLLTGSESDMDIKKELHPLSYYIYDRNELINQAFKVIGE